MTTALHDFQLIYLRESQLTIFASCHWIAYLFVPIIDLHSFAIVRRKCNRFWGIIVYIIEMLKEDVEMKIRQYILFVFIYVSVFYNIMTFLVDVIHFSQNTIGSFNIIDIYCLFYAEDTSKFLRRRNGFRKSFLWRACQVVWIMFLMNT